MKPDPRMSPLYHAQWIKLTPAEQDQIIDELKPKSPLQVGDSFQVQPDGSFLPLLPGDPVPEKPIKDKKLVGGGLTGDSLVIP